MIRRAPPGSSREARLKHRISRPSPVFPGLRLGAVSMLAPPGPPGKEGVTRRKCLGGLVPAPPGRPGDPPPPPVAPECGAPGAGPARAVQDSPEAPATAKDTRRHVCRESNEPLRKCRAPGARAPEHSSRTREGAGERGHDCSRVPARGARIQERGHRCSEEAQQAAAQARRLPGGCQS